MVVEALNRGSETTFGDEIEGWLDPKKEKELERVSRGKRFVWWLVCLTRMVIYLALR
jgi:hypothetical protein